MGKEIDAYTKKLSNVIHWGQQCTDLEAQAHWGRYLCVLISGFLEVAIAEICYQYVKNRAGINVTSFVTRTVQKTVYNPKLEAIKQLANRFNDDWGNNVDELLSDKQKAAIGNIIQNRHNIAHGRDSDLSFAKTCEYFNDVREAVRLLEDAFDNNFE